MWNNSNLFIIIKLTFDINHWNKCLVTYIYIYVHVIFVFYTFEVFKCI